MGAFWLWFIRPAAEALGALAFCLVLAGLLYLLTRGK
jgi:hypothetical protein